jgi:hypothetical protein
MEAVKWVCTKDDPQGKSTFVRPNGTLGRIHSEEARADNRSRAEIAASSRAAQRELMCQNGVNGAIACNRNFLEFDSAEAGISAGGWGTSVQTDGTAKGTEWGGASKGTGKGFGVNAGICVKIKGAKKHDHSVTVGGAAGYVYGSVDPLNQSACIGGQFPPGLDANVGVK